MCMCLCIVCIRMYLCVYVVLCYIHMHPKHRLHVFSPRSSDCRKACVVICPTECINWAASVDWPDVILKM